MFFNTRLWSLEASRFLLSGGSSLARLCLSSQTYLAFSKKEMIVAGFRVLWRTTLFGESSQDSYPSSVSFYTYSHCCVLQAWVFAWLDSSDPRYALYAAAYLAPWVK